MKRDEKLLKYCNRRKLPFTIHLADLNDRAKLEYASNGKRCSGLSKLLQRLSRTGKIDYSVTLGKGVMIRSVSLPETEGKSGDVHVDVEVKALNELLHPIRNGIRDIVESLDDDNCPAVIAKLDSTVDKMFTRQLEMDDTLTKIVSYVEAISRHIGRTEVNDANNSRD